MTIEDIVSKACEYDVCECGYTKRCHDYADIHLRLGACDNFVLSEEGRCEVCKERETGSGKLFYFTNHTHSRQME